MTAEGMGPALTDQESHLLHQLLSGEDKAFETLVKTFGGRMLATARRLLGNEEDAREAVQDAFLSSFKAIPRFKGDSRLSTWLHRILINAALMKERRQQSRPTPVQINDLLPTFLPDGHRADPGPEWRQMENELTRADLRKIVRAQIDRLPAEARAVLILRDIEGLSTEETASILETTPNSIKVRLHRARQALRTLLDPHFRRLS